MSTQKKGKVVEVLRSGEVVGRKEPLLAPHTVRQDLITSWIGRLNAESETRYVESMRANVEAKIDFYRARDRALDIENILTADREERAGKLLETQNYRASQQRLFKHAEKMDNLAFEKQQLQEQKEIDRLKSEAQRREMPREQRLKKEMEEKLERAREEKLYLIEEQKLRIEMLGLLEQQKQERVTDYVARVHREEGRDVDPSDTQTWTDLDRREFERFDDDCATLADMM